MNGFLFLIKYNIYVYNMNKEDIIKKAYYDPEEGFVGITKLHYKLKSQGISLNDIKKFISKQEVYQRNKKNNEKGNSFIPRYPLQEFQIDLIYLDYPTLNLHKYALCCIDAFSKKANIELLKKKDAGDVTLAMSKVFLRMGLPDLLYCDEGSEFKNKTFLKLMKEHGVEVIFAIGHATFVERFNRTIKEMLNKYTQSTNSKTITTVISKMVNNYNNSFHSSIGMTPNEVTDKTKHVAQLNILKHSYQKKREPLKIGQQVRIQLKETSSTKGYKPKFSKTIHTITNKNRYYYTVSDSDKMYIRSNLRPVSEVETNTNEPDNIGTLEYRAKHLHKHKEDAKYNIPETNASERKDNLRKREPKFRLVDDKYGNVLF